MEAENRDDNAQQDAEGVMNNDQQNDAELAQEEALLLA